MEEITITYETLFELLMREKNREELQALGQNFYEQIVDYLKEKKAMAKNSKELDNVHKILKELYERREKKILNLSLLASRTDPGVIEQKSFLAEEKLLFDRLYATLSEHRQNVLSSLFNQEKPETPKSGAEGQSLQTTVRFLNAVPKFLGPELEVYGPYEEDDVANLPPELAKVLISKGRAEEIK